MFDMILSDVLDLIKAVFNLKFLVIQVERDLHESKSKYK